jgi:hypothetical protein
MAMSWPYIAGFFDGEGSIRIPQGNGAMGIHIGIHQSANRGLVLLTKIKEFLKENGIASGLQHQRDIPNTGKPMYRLYIYNSAAALRFIDFIFPYVHIKKLECQDISRLIRMYPPYYKWLARRMASVGCEVCGKPRRVHRSRTCGSVECRSTLIWKVRRGQATQGRILSITRRAAQQPGL